MNFLPSDRLSGEPDLLSLSGQTMSQKLKSPRIWTEGQACHNFFVKKPKIFENVKSERAAGNFQKSQTPHASIIISKNSQI